MKTAAILSFWTLGIMSVFSQHGLTSRHNMFRPGDEIVKQQVEYKDPGRSGRDVLWDFGKLKTQKDEYKLFYVFGKDSLVTGIERQTMYFYSLSGDSLLCHGYENPTTLMVNEQPELLLRFPVRYGDSTFCYYSGNGKYCDQLRISAMGSVTSKADAYGTMILPDGDTLKNVIRVRTVKRFANRTEPLFFIDSNDSRKSTRMLTSKRTVETLEPTAAQASLSESKEMRRTVAVSSDSIRHRMTGDTVLLGSETCRWYVKGYRYPIFETVKHITDKHGERSTFFDVAYFHHPDKHYYLDDDEENRTLREENKRTLEPQKAEPWAGLTYNSYPNPVINDLNIEVYLPKAGRVQMQLTSRPGLIVWTKDFGTWNEGIHKTSVFAGGFPSGEYVLNMWFDEYAVGEVILKM